MSISKAFDRVFIFVFEAAIVALVVIVVDIIVGLLVLGAMTLGGQN